MARRQLTRDQRQMLLVAFGAVVVAIVFVIAAIIAGGEARNSARPAIDDEDYEPFPVNDYDPILGSIEDEGPIVYPDLLGGVRAFALDYVDGALVALHLLAPGSTEDDPCFVQLDETRRGYVDCDGEPVHPDELGRFRLIRGTPDDDGDIEIAVDLREVLPPPAATSTTTAAAGGSGPATTTTAGKRAATATAGAP